MPCGLHIYICTYINPRFIFRWSHEPHTINHVELYNSQVNGLFIPAAVLDKPFFSPDYDDARNYGRSVYTRRCGIRLEIRLEE